MKKKKKILKLFSIYDTESGNYPFYPVVYHSNLNAYLKFLKFIKECGDKNYELHYIGNIEYDKEKQITGVQMNTYVYKIDYDIEKNVCLKFILSSNDILEKVKDNIDDFFSQLFS